MTDTLRTTPLHALHVSQGARMVPFAGYEMPVQYPTGVMAEHAHTRFHMAASHNGGGFAQVGQAGVGARADEHRVDLLAEQRSRCMAPTPRWRWKRWCPSRWPSCARAASAMPC